MTEEFVNRGLEGARFQRVDLTGASFTEAYLIGARFHEVDLSGVRIRGAYLSDVDVWGDVVSLRVNGVDVAPLVEAELERRHPDRAKLHPTDADGFRDAWTAIERLWADTVEQAGGLEPALLHERVEGEWSFIETLRHLAFATDCWIGMVLRGDPSPWDPLDLPWDEMPDTPGVPRDREVRPSLGEVLALRAGRVAMVRQVMDDLSDAQLASTTEPVLGPGWQEPESFTVAHVLSTVLNEEWWHRQFAERDLDVLRARA